MEYRRAIEDLSSQDPALAARWSESLFGGCQILPDEVNPPKICRDPTDDKFLSCAKRAGAQYLVTGDKDLKVLEGKFPFRILSPRELLKVL